MQQSDLRIIKKTTACVCIILVVFHYTKNAHLLSSYSSSSDSSPTVSSSISSYSSQLLLGRPNQYSKAFDESFGFFTDISNEDWDAYRSRFQNHNRYMDGDVRMNKIHLDTTDDSNKNANGGTSIDSTEVEGKENQSSAAHLFYQNNYDSEFTCPHEMQLGSRTDGRLVETPKWVCDPHRIIPMSKQRERKSANGKGDANTDGCLSYIFTEEDSKTFIKDLNMLLDQECEIHVFSKFLYNMVFLSRRSLGRRVHVHPWGLEGQKDVAKGRREYMTFQETLKELNHVGRTIDLLSIDCEGCEWSAYMDFLNEDVTVTQILIELHKAPYQINDFFLEMRRNGYVIFHKESNTVTANEGGKNQEYSFLRLAPEFFLNSI